MKVLCTALILMSAWALAQTAPAGGAPNHAVMLAAVEQTSYSTIAQLQAMRIDKWKTESAQKQQAQQNAESLVRNLTAALPGMVAAARSQPNGFSANFKLYRNLGALYDVLLQLTESAGAFGSKGEFQALGEQLQGWDEIRRNYGDYLQQLAAAKDVTAAPSTSAGKVGSKAGRPKRVIVDDEPPPKKTKKK